MRVISVRLRYVLTVGVFALLLAACNQAPASASPTPRLSPLANTDWTATTIFGRPIPSGTNVTLLFAVVQASGFSGCNNFTLPYAVQDTGLRFGPVSATRASCGATLDAVETAYYTNLGLVTHYQLTGDTLNLTSGTGETVLSYARMAPATVEGPWTVTLVNNGNGAVSSVPTGVGAAISFMPDGTVQGFGGCNNFSGGYSTGANNKIAIGPLMAQMKACGDPADTFELQFLTALQSSTKWDVTAGTLDLRDDSGAQQVKATTAIQ